MAGVNAGVWLAWLGASWALVVASVELVAVTRARQRNVACSRSTGSTPWRPRHPGSALRPAEALRSPRFVLVRPCAGDEAQLRRTLASLVRARWSFSLQVRLTVSETADAASPIARDVAARLGRAGLDARAVVVPPTGPNRKTSQLAGVVDPMLESGRIDGVIVVDSDVDLAGVDLDALVEPLLEAGAHVGATWCPPVEQGLGGTPGDRLSAAVLAGSMHAFPLLGTLDAGGLVGKLFAVRGDALRVIGGFSPLVHHLGEDMQLARRLRSHGWAVHMNEQVVQSRASGRSIREVFARYVRWLLVIRAQRPHLLPAYPLLLAATPLVLALCLASVRSAPWVAGMALLLATAGRILVARTAARFAGRASGLRLACADAALADLLLLVAFVRALGPRRVRWRQRVLRLGRRGLLEHEPPDEAIERGARPGAQA